MKNIFVETQGAFGKLKRFGFSAGTREALPNGESSSSFLPRN